MTPSSTRTIRKTALVAVTALGSMAAAVQPVHSYRSNDGQLTIHYGSFLIVAQPDGSHRMEIKGGIDATSRTQGLHLKGETSTAVLATVNGRTVFRTVHVERSVELVKTLSAANGSHVTDISCDRADYKAGNNESTVKASGHVHIVDRDGSKHDVISATGSSCLATLVAGGSGKDSQSPLRAANLAGPVTVHLEQAPQAKGKPPGTIDATSDSLIYGQSSGGPEITLKGNVMVTGRNGAIDGRLGPNQLLVLQLDSQGRVKSAYGGGSK